MVDLLSSVRIKAKLLQKAKLKSNPNFQLKDAYEILAKTAGFANWREWKDILNDHSPFAPPGAAMWHVWYSNYSEAKEHLQKNENLFLLPYQKHFFVCDIHYIEFIGVSDSKLLAIIGNNWVEPKDLDAWKKLQKLLHKKGK